MYDFQILAIIWATVFVASYMAHKTRLTAVLWYLFFGAILVNLKIIPVKLPVFIEEFSELGIIIIMFALGFEENVNNFMKSIKRSWGIAFFGAIIPFAVAYFIVLHYWNDVNVAMLCGLAMTATAVSLTMVSLKTEGLNNTPAATGIMTSAVLDDIASLIFVALLVPIATGESSITLDGILLIVGKAVVFFVLVTLIGGWLFPSNKKYLRFVPYLGKLGLHHMLSMGRGEYTILSLLLIALLMGLLAHNFGFHPAVGAYMAGLIVHRSYFNFHEEKQIDFYHQARQMIDNIAFSWIGPVFFVALGSKLVFEWTLFKDVLPGAILLFVGLFIGQVSSASLAARYTGNFDWSQSLMIGFGMLGRAELAFVVLDIAYVQNKIIPIEAFYTLMITIFLLNVSVPLTIRWWKIKFNDTSKL